MNRNILVLGVVALLTIGVIAIFLASKNGGNILNIFQNITNQIINNSYFTQLIADGVTTKEDLESIAEIRPYGDGFVGVSKATLDWDQSQALAKRTGARVLAVEDVGIESRENLLTWIGTTFKSHLSSPAWVSHQGEPGFLPSSETPAANETSAPRKVLLHWQRQVSSSLVSTRQPLSDLFLGDLKPVTVKTEWPYAISQYFIGAEHQSKVLRIDGKACDRYLLAHTPSLLEFAIPQGYTRFKATGFAPFDTQADRPLPGDWVYLVEVDDKLVFESQELRTYPNYQAPIDITFAAGAKKLVLKTISHGGDQNGHSLWGYPTLSGGSGGAHLPPTPTHRTP